MLRVPELKADDQPFDPNTPFSPAPVKGMDHVLQVKSGGMTTADTSAAPGRTIREEARTEDPERAVRQAVFDDAVVRDALTGLHRNGNAFRREIEAGPGRIAAIVNEQTDEFLREQRKDLASSLDNDRQKAFFQMGFDAYSNDTAAWREAVRDHKAKEYEKEVGERQRGMFLELAVGPEALFDDAVQSRYRDMVLMSVDDEHRDSPAEVRQAALDQADNEFCRSVLDRRLQEDPSSTRPLIESPAVRRVLGEETAGRYEEQARTALRRDELASLGRTWLEQDIGPDDAADQAKRIQDETERDIAVREYSRLRQRQNQSLAREHRAFIESAWQETDPARNGPDADQRRDRLRRTDPELADQLDDIRAERSRTGGMSTTTEYARLLELTDDFDQVSAAEGLRDRQAVMELYRDLGPDSDAFQTYMALVDGTADPEQRKRLGSLRRARDAAVRLCGEDLDRASLGEFLQRYSEDSRIQRERHGYTELDSGEEQAIMQKTAAAMGWHG